MRGLLVLALLSALALAAGRKQHQAKAFGVLRRSQSAHAQQPKYEPHLIGGRRFNRLAHASRVKRGAFDDPRRHPSGIPLLAGGSGAQPMKREYDGAAYSIDNSPEALLLDKNLIKQLLLTKKREKLRKLVGSAIDHQSGGVYRQYDHENDIDWPRDKKNAEEQDEEQLRSALSDLLAKKLLTMARDGSLDEYYERRRRLIRKRESPDPWFPALDLEERRINKRDHLVDSSGEYDDESEDDDDSDVLTDQQFAKFLNDESIDLTDDNNNIEPKQLENQENQLIRKRSLSKMSQDDSTKRQLKAIFSSDLSAGAAPPTNSKLSERRKRSIPTIPRFPRAIDWDDYFGYDRRRKKSAAVPVDVRATVTPPGATDERLLAERKTTAEEQEKDEMHDWLINNYFKYMAMAMGNKKK